MSRRSLLSRVLEERERERETEALMTKQSGTKCSHCGNKGHNSRTCSEKVGLKLFGVTILKHKVNESMKKSFSMGNLTSNNAAESSIDRGYLSDGLVRLKGDGNERKKGIPWTEEEHRTFLAGLEKLGKGNWRGISKNFVTTRTPTQVASHAQKYFMRRAISNKNKRRSSLFDMAIKDSSPISKTESSESVKQSNGVLEQVSSSAQIANQIADRAIEAPQATPMATTGAYPYFRGFPYLEGSSDGKLSYLEAKVYPTLSFVPMLNLPNRSYVYHPKPYDNFTNYTPIAPHSSVIASPQTALDCASKTEPPNSSTVNTELELGIAPSQVHDQTKLSNSVGAISVI